MRMHTECLTEEGARLFPLLSRFREFYLAGGTALGLHIGHRISVDFDLFNPKQIPRTLLDRAEKIFGRSRITVLVNNADELTLTVGAVKVTFLAYPFPLVEPLVESEGIRLLSVREIAATKAYTIGRRGEYKDYVDLYFVMSEKHASLRDIIALAERKYKDAFNSRLFLEQLIFLDDVEPADILFLRGSVAWPQMIGFFKNEISRLEL